MWVRAGRVVLALLVVCGALAACGSQQADSGIYAWGYNGFGQLGTGNTTDAKLPVASVSGGDIADENPIAVSSGANHVCALVQGGRVYCWGDNSHGQLGNGTNTSSSDPVQVDPGGALSGKSITWISAGGNHTCAVAVPGNVFCWGDNTYGELGNGSTNDSNVPVRVNTTSHFGNSSIRQVHLGYNHTCAVNTGGSVFCWGDNESGQLGNASLSSSSKAVVTLPPPDELTDLVSVISAGGNNSCELTNRGTAYCWGDNSRGQLGNGNMQSSSTPTAVAGSGVLGTTKVAAISVGASHACAVTRTAGVACWGGNSQGQVGNGNTTDQLKPVAVSTQNGISGAPFLFVTSGGFHTCAWTSAGRAYCWGANGFGQLGNGTDTGSSVPTEVVTAKTSLNGRTAQQLSAGDNFTVELAVP